MENYFTKMPHTQSNTTPSKSQPFAPEANHCGFEKIAPYLKVPQKCLVFKIRDYGLLIEYEIVNEQSYDVHFHPVYLSRIRSEFEVFDSN